MQDGEAGRGHLIRQFTQVKAQVARLRANVEAKEKKVAELSGKLSLAEEVRRLCTEATAAIPELTRTVTTLERTLAKVDALAEYFRCMGKRFKEKVSLRGAKVS